MIATVNDVQVNVEIGESLKDAVLDMIRCNNLYLDSIRDLDRVEEYQVSISETQWEIFQLKDWLENEGRY